MLLVKAYSLVTIINLYGRSKPSNLMLFCDVSQIINIAFSFMFHYMNFCWLHFLDLSFSAIFGYVFTFSLSKLCFSETKIADSCAFSQIC